MNGADDAAWHHGEKFGKAGQHHVLHLGLGQDLGQLVGKHVDDDQRRHARVVELVHHFASGVERIGIDQDATSLEHAKRRHRVAQAVGHLHRHTVTRMQAQDTAQVASESIRQGINLAVGQAAVHAVGHHASEGLVLGAALRKVRAAFVHQGGDRAVLGMRQFGGNAGGHGGRVPKTWGG